MAKLILLTCESESCPDSEGAGLGDAGDPAQNGNKVLRLPGDGLRLLIGAKAVLDEGLKIGEACLVAHGMKEQHVGEVKEADNTCALVCCKSARLCRPSCYQHGQILAAAAD